MLITKTNKNLFTIVESIAAKEIERDPLDFIRRESAMLPDKIIMNSNGSFSNEENKGFDVVDEVNESDEETNKATFITNFGDDNGRHDDSDNEVPHTPVQ